MNDRLKAMDNLYVEASELLEAFSHIENAFISREKSGFGDDEVYRSFSDSFDDIETYQKKCAQILSNLYECALKSTPELSPAILSLDSFFKFPLDKSSAASASSVVRSLCQTIERLYQMEIRREANYAKVRLENYYKTDYPKNALLVYVIYPFLFPNSPPAHTNHGESRAIGGLLSDMGYNVDIVNTRFCGDIDAKKYELIIGSGGFFESLCTTVCANGGNCRTIYYLTESSPYVSNIAELNRITYFKERNGSALPFERLNRNCLNLDVLALSDAAICIGNEQTAGTYGGMFKKLYTLNASAFELNFTPNLDGGGEIFKNFMWYGGAGALHKGLDLCLEAFRSLPNLKLHIVGNVGSELYDFYRNDIENSENILYYGFLNKDSDEFIEVCKSCGFCILPSCAEGQSTSLLTAMAGALIPVGTRQVGIDLDECGGFFIEDIDVNSMAEFILRLSEMELPDLSQRREMAYRYVRKNHTIDAYVKNLRNILYEITGAEG